MSQPRTAIVTGSTSGIGLGIARALAAQGLNVMLNGFGEAAAIEKERQGIIDEFKVKALYSPADMPKPAEIVDMVENRRSADRRCRHARQQCRHSIRFADRRFPAGEVECRSSRSICRAAFHTIRLRCPL